jgi:transcription antitermination factor NusG
LDTALHASFHPPAVNISGIQLPCYAVKVRSRSEECIAQALQRKGYQVLFTHYVQTRKYSDRSRKVSVALFPGYIFCHFDSANSLPILSTPGVTYIVGCRNNFVPLSTEELAVVKALCHNSIPSRPVPYLPLGERVRIDSGPLAGVFGILQNFKGTERVVVSIDLLQSSVALEVGKDVISVAA